MNLFTNLHNPYQLYISISFIYMYAYKHILSYILNLSIILMSLFANTLLCLSLTRLLNKRT